MGSDDADDVAPGSSSAEMRAKQGTNQAVQTHQIDQASQADSHLQLHQPHTEAWTRDWGGLLRTARQIAGLSLTQLSQASGLSKGYLSKLESSSPGAANPSRSTLAALARALPSFRPLAHTLAPGLGAEQLDYSRATHPTEAEQDAQYTERYGYVSRDGSASDHDTFSPESIRIGWRELEVLAALITLERAALPMRITEPMLAHAVGRRAEAVRAVLDRLAHQNLIAMAASGGPGSARTYRLAPHIAERLGVTRLGDVLMLAASLTSSSGTGPNTSPVKRAQTEHGHLPGTNGPETRFGYPDISSIERQHS